MLKDKISFDDLTSLKNEVKYQELKEFEEDLIELKRLINKMGKVKA